MTSSEVYHVWKWYKWEHGEWQDVFQGTYEECEAYIQKEFPEIDRNKCRISLTKPAWEKSMVGTAYPPYHRW